jgi:hypothetical protein
MAEARIDHDWNQTASLMALLANIHRPPRKFKTFTADDFHPLKQGSPTRRIEGQSDRAFELLKQTFTQESPHARAEP